MGARAGCFYCWHVAIITEDGSDDSIIHVVFCAKKKKKINASGLKRKTSQ